MEGESREEYRKRRIAVNKAIKKYLKGRTLWNPNLPIPYEGKTYIAGPYVKALHGELKSGLELNKEFNIDEFREDIQGEAEATLRKSDDGNIEESGVDTAHMDEN